MKLLQLLRRFWMIFFNVPKGIDQIEPAKASHHQVSDDQYWEERWAH